MSNPLNAFEDFLEELRDENLIEKPRENSVQVESKHSSDLAIPVSVPETESTSPVINQLKESNLSEENESKVSAESEASEGGNETAIAVMEYGASDAEIPVAADISDEELRALLAEAEELDRIAESGATERPQTTSENSETLREYPVSEDEVSSTEISVYSDPSDPTQRDEEIDSESEEPFKSSTREITNGPKDSYDDSHGFKIMVGEETSGFSEVAEGSINGDKEELWNGEDDSSFNSSSSTLKNAAKPPSPLESINAAYNAVQTKDEIGNLKSDIGETNDETSPPSDDPETDYSATRHRAAAEISTLKMVEHLISGIEREQLKTISKPFDAYGVDLALHELLQVAKSTNGAIDRSKVAEAEFKFSEATQAWYAALTHRDEKISVGHLRRYCETTKPALSAEALMALARFYKNSGYSESTRGKFDMTVTRLFGRDSGDDRRHLVFGRTEIAKLVSVMYDDWESVEIVDFDQAKVQEIVATFDSFITEVTKATVFDEVASSQLFIRVRKFKESCGETFYAPEVIAAVVDSNVTIGNKYVELVHKARDIKTADELEAKYKSLLDHAISEATSKSLNLSELLNQPAQRVTPKREPAVAKSPEAEKKPRAAAVPYNYDSPPPKKLFGISRNLAIAAILSIIAGVGTFFYLQSTDSQSNKSADVKSVDLSNSSLKVYLKTAKISGKSFIGIVENGWGAMSEDQKRDVLKKIQSAGTNKGYVEVILLDEKGAQVGFASNTSITTDSVVRFE